MHIIVNAYWQELEFELPLLDLAQESWRRCVDTYLDPPDDICGWTDAPKFEGWTFLVRPRSVVLLLAKA
jgi:glycogen operon protein